MPVIKDKQFTLTMDNYSKPTISKCPSWLENITPVSTRSIPESKTVSFTFKLIEDAVNFDDTQIVFTNVAGGTGMTVNITREFQAPAITATGTMAPSVNSLSGNSLHMYRVASGQQSKAQIKVYSLGGSTLITPGNWCYQRIVSTPNNYEKVYEIYWDGNTNDLNTAYNGSFYLKNVSDNNKQLTGTLYQDAARPTFSSDYSCVRFNEPTNTWCYFDVLDNTNLYGKYNFTFNIYSPAGVNITGSASFGSISFSKTKSWSSNSPYDTFKFNIGGTSYCLGGNATSIGSIVFRSNSSTYFPDYEFKMYNYMPIYKGYFASSKDNKTNRFWVFLETTGKTFDQIKDSDMQSAYSGWRLPSKEEWMSFVGGTIPVDDGWHAFPSNPSSLFTTLIPSDHWVKCATNDPNYRLDLDRPNNRWSIDINDYDNNTERRIYLISK